MFRGIVSAAAALAAALAPGGTAAAEGPGSAAADSVAPVVSADVPVSDGTVLYIRYGEPGAVRILRHSVTGDSLSIAEAARQESTAVAAASAARAAIASATPAAPPAGPPAAAAPTAPGLGPAPVSQPADLAESVRRILREELRASLAEHGTAPRSSAAPSAPRAGWLDAPVGTGLPLGSAEPRPTTPDRSWTVTRSRPDADTLVADTLASAPGAAPTAPAEPGRMPVTSLTTQVPLPSRTFVTESLVEGGLFRTNVVLFETSRDGLLPRSREVLDVVAEVLRDFPDVRIRVEGHADARGSADTNLELSRRRAETVRRYLIEEGGIPAARLTAEGYGESRPLETGTSPTALALNRRVEFHVLNPEALRRVTGEASPPEGNGP